MVATFAKCFPILLTINRERERKLAELKKEKEEFTQGFWNVKTITLGGLGKDPVIEGLLKHRGLFSLVCFHCYCLGVVIFFDEYFKKSFFIYSTEADEASDLETPLSTSRSPFHAQSTARSPGTIFQTPRNSSDRFAYFCMFSNL